MVHELTARGHEVRVPQLPDPEAPQPEAWLKTLAAEVADPADTVLVGHSIGGVNVLRLLEQHDSAIFAGALLVATPAHEVGYDALAGFFAGGFDWARIRRAAAQIRVLVAVDDPVLTRPPRTRAAVQRAPGRHRAGDPGWSALQPPAGPARAPRGHRAGRRTAAVSRSPSCSPAGYGRAFEAFLERVHALAATQVGHQGNAVLPPPGPPDRDAPDPR
ncbi:alpha/beta hydrolase [Nonomuraea sp. NPDC059194]|uniref:alpha/beta hydrolase n=1 Tax=Nonomuraea sp. NPDC059194 TaxID=3346764 RepID=UPI0036BFA85D